MDTKDFKLPDLGEGAHEDQVLRVMEIPPPLREGVRGWVGRDS